MSLLLGTTFLVYVHRIKRIKRLKRRYINKSKNKNKAIIKKNKTRDLVILRNSFIC